MNELNFVEMFNRCVNVQLKCGHLIVCLVFVSVNLFVIDLLLQKTTIRKEPYLLL